MTFDPRPRPPLRAYAVDYANERLHIVHAGPGGARMAVLVCDVGASVRPVEDDDHDEWTTKSSLGWKLAPAQPAACSSDPPPTPVFLRERQARFRADSGAGHDQRLPFTGRIKLPWNPITRAEVETGLIIAGTGPWTPGTGRLG